MRSHILTLIFTLTLTAMASAQPPLPPNEPMDPAYRHFLRSPSTYKAISVLGRGYTEQRFSPYGYGSLAVEPSRLHQRITPYGFESHEYVPGYAGTNVTPWSYDAYRVPGYTRSFYQPGFVPVPPR